MVSSLLMISFNFFGTSKVSKNINRIIDSYFSSIFIKLTEIQNHLRFIKIFIFISNRRMLNYQSYLEG